jgi:ABC-type amino acid transport substrate-binding protein
MSARTNIVATLLLAACGAGAAAEEKVTVAVFAPNGTFESGDARYSFASRLAQQIGAASGLGAEPKAFAHASDFEAALKRGQVDFAVVDAVYLAERGAPWPVLAIATAGGDTASRWSLFSTETGGVLDLKGKRLAYAATSARDAQFVDNALLEGELAKPFSARQPAPDASSAVAAVSLHRADCVFAPDALGHGLRRVFDAGKIPNPALVAVKPGLSAEVVEKVKRAALAHGGSGAYDGWKAGGAEPYRSLGARMAQRSRRPVMAEPQVVPLEEGDPLAALQLEPALLDLKDQFWAPTGSP